MTLGQKLKLLLKEKNMTQEDLAEQLNVSRQAVGKWVNDKGIPEVGKLVQISGLFGVSLDYLLKEEYDGQAGAENIGGRSVSENIGGQPVEDGCYVSKEMLDGYLFYHRQNIIKIVCGISLLLLPNMFEYFTDSYFAVELLYWIAAATGIILLLWPAFRIKRYQEIKSEKLLFDDKVFEDFCREREKNRKKYAVMLIVGVVILFISSEMTGYQADHWGRWAADIAGWFLDTAWIVLIFWASLSIHVENIVVRNAKRAPKSRRRRRYQWLYAAVPVTLIASAVGLITNVWSPIAPILLLLCGLLITVCKLAVEGRETE